MASNPTVSSLATAFAGKSASLDIQRPAAAGAFVGKDTFAAVAARAANAHGLPTPPNSISPNLPPQTIKAQPSREQMASHLDSDIDLLDAVDHANSQDQPHHGFSVSAGDFGAADSVGNVTPALLAKHHLPGILLQQGPIAIRHVMNSLAQTVPGFADIPPAKARRLVVGALENRGGGGVKGDVEFEKVGWGRWDARMRGQPPRENRTIYPIQEGNLSPPMSASSFSPTRPLGIPSRNGHPSSKSRRLSHGSWTGESMISSHSERGDKVELEHDADKMSIDGEGSRPISILGASKRHARDLDFSDTDSEDWEKMGFEAFRKNSYSTSAGNRNRSYIIPAPRRTSSPFPKSFSSQHHHTHNHTSLKINSTAPALDFSGVDADSQEREAIQALLCMGSR